MNDLLITGIIFILIMILCLLWQPTRLLLREIFFHPLKDSEFTIVDDIDKNSETKKEQKKKPNHSSNTARQEPKSISA